MRLYRIWTFKETISKWIIIKTAHTFRKKGTIQINGCHLNESTALSFSSVVSSMPENWSQHVSSLRYTTCFIFFRICVFPWSILDQYPSFTFCLLVLNLQWMLKNPVEGNEWFLFSGLHYSPQLTSCTSDRKPLFVSFCLKLHNMVIIQVNKLTALFSHWKVYLVTLDVGRLALPAQLPVIQLR